jgi:hypothetical protein
MGMAGAGMAGAGAGMVGAGAGGGGGEPTPTPTQTEMQQQQQQQQTELTFFTPPSHQNGGEEVVGLVWVVAILENDHEGGASRRSRVLGSNPNPSWTTPTYHAAHYVDTQPADSSGSLACEMVRVGNSVPLLLIPDAGVAAEVNAAAARLRSTMGAVKANAFIARLGEGCYKLNTVYP